MKIRVLLLHYWKKGLSAAGTTKEICDVEGQGTVSERTARFWFHRFNEGDTSLEDKKRSGRPMVVNQEELRDLVEQQPTSSTRGLSNDLGASHNTIARHLHNLGFAKKNPLSVPHELTEQQSQRRIEICRELLSKPNDHRFWRRIVTSDEKWIFYRNSEHGKQWLKPGQPSKQVVVQNRYEKKVMLCVWWNIEGPIHWELVADGRAIDAGLYSEQLERVHAALRSKYPSLVNRRQVLLQHDNAPAHTSRVVKEKINELPGIEVLPHPAYSPDLAPSDYHLFRSLSHFLHGRRFNSEEDVKQGVTEFFASKPPEWYRRGIENLAERWLQVIENDGLYFAE